jgi:hypothetical protein
MNRPAHPPPPRASRRLHRLLGVTIALLLPVGTAAASAAPTLTIRASQDVVTRIGTFRTQDDATPAAAVRAFGPPSSRRHAGEGCRVEWRALRLRIYFANFGIVAPVVPACSSTGGLAQSFTVRSRRFRTWRGLRPGDRSSTIRSRHPSARFRRGSWWLRTATSRTGVRSDYPVVEALVSGGRVRVLRGWIGAAGE